MSPRLRPGLVVARRDDRQLQVGLEPPRRAVLPDVAEVRRLLDDLQQGRAPGRLRPAAAEALTRLERAGLLTAGLEPAVPATAATTAAAVSVTGPRRLLDALLPHLAAAGVSTQDEAGTRLLVAHGALQREATDPLVRDGVAHLVAVMTPWGWEVGPFVLPGSTACLRCVDATLRDHDPRHGVVLDQVARGAWPPALEPAWEPAVAASTVLAAGWIARDLLAHARAERPTTWSATVRLDAAPADGEGAGPVDLRRWLRHPHCGCAWDALAG